MGASGPRVLVVDDHPSWRQHVQSLLRLRGRWHIVGEASSGEEGVHRALTLAPDVILLDIELPDVNGLEVARRILAVAPALPVVFVSSHSSWDVIDAAFGTGAHGYVLKSEVPSDLVPAMHAALRGVHFLSGAIAGGARAAGADAKVRRQRHEVGFYAEDALMLDDFGRFAEAALKDGKAVIIATTRSREDELRRRLEPRLDLDLAIAQGRFVWVDEADALSGFMVNEWPDRTRFWKVVPSAIIKAARATSGGRLRVASCGECSDRLLRAGRIEAAIRLEQLWDELAGVFRIDALCGYLTAPGRDGDEADLQRIRTEHTAVRAR